MSTVLLLCFWLIGASMSLRMGEIVGQFLWDIFEAQPPETKP